MLKIDELSAAKELNSVVFKIHKTKRVTTCINSRVTNLSQLILSTVLKRITILIVTNSGSIELFDFTFKTPSLNLSY